MKWRIFFFNSEIFYLKRLFRLRFFVCFFFFPIYCRCTFVPCKTCYSEINVLCASLYRTRSCSSSMTWVLAVASSYLKEPTSTTPSLTSSRWAAISWDHQHIAIMFLLCLNISVTATWLVKLLVSCFLCTANTRCSRSVLRIVSLVTYLPKSDFKIQHFRKTRKKDKKKKAIE